MISLDTNIVIYALDPSESHKHEIARQLLDHMVQGRRFLARQVLGELLNATHKKRPGTLDKVRDVVALLDDELNIIETDLSSLVVASSVAERHKLQFWDALICVICRSAGATTLFSEDMKDGLKLGSLTVVNPFDETNKTMLEKYT